MPLFAGKGRFYMQNIFLIGFLGAGKSTVARYLAEQYGMNIIEMDEQIAHQERMSISKIFESRGEAYFRRLETSLLEGLQNQENTVVSCGGGVPMRECNVEAMKKSGTVIYLSASPTTVYHRVKNNHDRPLLEGHMNVDYIAGLLNERLPKYLAAADVTVETDGRAACEICEEIMDYCKDTCNK
jgi:shikimate kinase